MAGLETGPRQGRLRAGELAAATPDYRDRSVDLFRVLAVGLVVTGHWLAAVITFEDGQLGGRSALQLAGWTHWLTWVFQVIPLVFLVGGVAGAASWRSHRRRGGTWVGWMRGRADRLLGPVTVFVLLLCAAVAASRLAGVDPQLVDEAARLVGLALWFLVAYLPVVALTPLLLGLHDRWGLWVPAALAGLMVVGDALRFTTGAFAAGAANLGLIWLVAYHLGFAWRDGLLDGLGRALLLTCGGFGALLVLVAVGPYPVSMVGVADAPVDNTWPPTVAMLALGVGHTGLALLARGPARRWLLRRRVWTVVVAANGVVMTVYLWHMVPALVGALLLVATGVLPEPPLGSADWTGARLLWVGALALLMLPVALVFGRFERPRRRPMPVTRDRQGAAAAQCAGALDGLAAGTGSSSHTGVVSPLRPGDGPASATDPERRSRGSHQRWITAGAGLTAAVGVAVVCLGLFLMNQLGYHDVNRPLGVPWVPLGLFLGGVLLLRFADGDASLVIVSRRLGCDR